MVTALGVELQGRMVIIGEGGGEGPRLSVQIRKSSLSLAQLMAALECC